MAVLESGSVAGVFADADGTSKGLRVATMPKDAAGAYALGGVTGVLPAGLGASSVLWGMRMGPTGNRKAVITRIYSRFVARSAASVFTDVALELVRFSAANPTGGGAAVIANKRPNGIAATASQSLTGGPEGGANQLATTAGLVTTGMAFDATSAHVFNYIPVISAGSPAVGALFERSIENDAGLEHPFELAVGEGLCIRTVGVIPTGLTLQGHIQVSWSERVGNG